MPSKLGKYNLIRTLGEGAYSKVKEGVDTSDPEKKHYAIKIHRADNPKFNKKTMIEVIENEADAISKLNHPHIINLVDYKAEDKVEKAHGATYDVICVMVEEIAANGELFFYVKNSGYFKEKIARHFFHQILSGLEYIHKEGYAHRDIKPDNILLDTNFNIKIADFGFAGLLTGKIGTGQMTTKLGTYNYQAPEINQGIPYKGESVDLFAASIVLFIMVAGTPPFNAAEPEDFFFKLIINKRWDLFWKYHCRSKPSGTNFFSEEFKHLIENSLSYDPNFRLTTEGIKSHPWFKGALPTYEEVLLEFKLRKEVTDEAQEIEIKQKKTEKKGVKKAYTKSRGFGDSNRDYGDEEEEMKSGPLEIKKAIKAFEKAAGKKTQFFLPENPDLIEELFQQFCTSKQDQEDEVELTLDSENYKMTLLQEKNGLEAVVKITRVADSDNFCIDFTKKQGALMEFLDFYKDIQVYIETQLGYREEVEAVEEGEEENE